jgi:hypothetical protein
MYFLIIEREVVDCTHLAQDSIKYGVNGHYRKLYFYNRPTSTTFIRTYYHWFHEEFGNI